jgi:hypothetical protein
MERCNIRARVDSALGPIFQASVPGRPISPITTGSGHENAARVYDGAYSVNDSRQNPFEIGVAAARYMNGIHAHDENNELDSRCLTTLPYADGAS